MKYTTGILVFIVLIFGIAVKSATIVHQIEALEARSAHCSQGVLSSFDTLCLESANLDFYDDGTISGAFYSISAPLINAFGGCAKLEGNFSSCDMELEVVTRGNANLIDISHDPHLARFLFSTSSGGQCVGEYEIPTYQDSWWTVLGCTGDPQTSLCLDCLSLLTCATTTAVTSDQLFLCTSVCPTAVMEVSQELCEACQQANSLAGTITAACSQHPDTTECVTHLSAIDELAAELQSQTAPLCPEVAATDVCELLGPCATAGALGSTAEKPLTPDAIKQAVVGYSQLGKFASSCGGCTAAVAELSKNLTAKMDSCNELDDDALRIHCLDQIEQMEEQYQAACQELPACTASSGIDAIEQLKFVIGVYAAAAVASVLASPLLLSYLVLVPTLTLAVGVPILVTTIIPLALTTALLVFPFGILLG